MGGGAVTSKGHADVVSSGNDEVGNRKKQTALNRKKQKTKVLFSRAPSVLKCVTQKQLEQGHFTGGQQEDKKKG